MAFKAIRIGQTISIEHFPLFMRLVTFNACRNFLGLFFPEFASDNLFMYLLNVGMTLHTCVRNIVTMDRGFRVGMRQQIM